LPGWERSRVSGGVLWHASVSEQRLHGSHTCNTGEHQRRPNDPEVQAIAAFLRVLNALENIRSSINVAQRGRTTTRAADLRDLARLSLAETVDAIEVLSQGALATDACWSPANQTAMA
jgi:hypothetical protein